MRRFALLALTLWGTACGGAEQRPGVELGWGAPDDAEPAEAFAVDHPLRGVAEAVQAGDCAAVVAESEAVQQFLEGEVRRVLHSRPTSRSRGRAPDGEPGLDDDAPPLRLPTSGPTPRGVDAAAARELLDGTIYRQPPLLEVGEHGFRLPRWWSRSYGYCLAEVGQLDAAAGVFTLLLWEGVDADALWRLVLVSVWAGRTDLALAILQAWPGDVPRPAAYDPLVARLRRGESVPFDTRSARLWLD